MPVVHQSETRGLTKVSVLVVLKYSL